MVTRRTTTGHGECGDSVRQRWLTAQGCCNSCALATELPQYCAKPPAWSLAIVKASPWGIIGDFLTAFLITASHLIAMLFVLICNFNSRSATRSHKISSVILNYGVTRMKTSSKSFSDGSCNFDKGMACVLVIIVRRAGLLWSQQDFEWRWSVPLFKCLTVLEFSFILFDLCLLITFFNFIIIYVPIVTFWIFTYHKIWILSIMFCFIWSYWIVYFLACLEVSWRVVS